MPNALDAERRLLSCCFISDSAESNLDQVVAAGIEPTDFDDPDYRKIYECLRSIRAAGIRLDAMAVWEHLTKTGELRPHMRLQILDLTGKYAEPTSLHLKRYTRELREAKARRELLRDSIALTEAVISQDLETTAKIRSRLAAWDTAHHDGLPEICEFNDLCPEEPLPPVVIDGILHRSGKLMIGGNSKSNKTWVLIQLGLAVASGTDWLGMKTSKGRVLFLNFEVERSVFRRRVAKVAHAMRLNQWEMDILDLRGHAADLKILVPKIVSRASGRNYALIILDPIYKALGDRDENSAGDIAALLNELEALAVRTGAAVAFSHHFAKGSAAGKDSRDRVSGSGVWARDPDAIITLTQHATVDCFTASFSLRNFAPKPECVLRLSPPVMEVATDLDPADLKQPGRPQEFADSAVLSLLPIDGATFTQWKTKAIAAGMSDHTFKRKAKALYESGQVTKLLNRYHPATATPANEDEP